MSDTIEHKAEVTEIEDCPFCNVSENPESLFDLSSPIDDQGDVLLKPDLGMLMPGHLLAVTRDHYTSFAQLGRTRLRAVNERLSLYEIELAGRFSRYFRMEHGSDNILDCGSGGCIEHAHIHLIPADDDVGVSIQEELPWQQLDSYEDLSEYGGRPYIYLGRLAMHYVVPSPRLPGQWVRRRVATIKGLDQWDWALYDAREDLQSTFEGLRVFPLKIFSESTK